MNQEQTIKNQKDLAYLLKFGENHLTETMQLWSESSMLTAQLKREDAIRGIKEQRYFIITSQAVGFLSTFNQKD